MPWRNWADSTAYWDCLVPCIQTDCWNVVRKVNFVDGFHVEGEWRLKNGCRPAQSCCLKIWQRITSGIVPVISYIITGFRIRNMSNPRNIKINTVASGIMVNVEVLWRSERDMHPCLGFIPTIHTLLVWQTCLDAGFVMVCGRTNSLQLKFGSVKQSNNRHPHNQ